MSVNTSLFIAEVFYLSIVFKCIRIFRINNVLKSTITSKFELINKIFLSDGIFNRMIA